MESGSINMTNPTSVNENEQKAKLLVLSYQGEK